MWRNNPRCGICRLRFCPAMTERMTENNGGIVDDLGDPGASNCGVGRGDGHAGGGMCGGGLIDRSVAEIQPTAVGGSFDLPDLTYIEGS